LMLSENNFEDEIDNLEFESNTEEDENNNQENLEKLAHEFHLTLEDVQQFSEEQLKLLTEASEQTKEEIRNSQSLINNQDNIQVEEKILCYSEEEQTVTAIILKPEEPDSYNHIISKEEIRKAMLRFMEDYRVLDVMHADKSGKLFPLKERRLGEEDRQIWHDDLRLIENYQLDSDQFIGDPPRLVRKGTWVQTWKILNSAIWEDIKKCIYTGFSAGGIGALTNES
ncbi:MAG: XkdF-like putative serine protease domain-containing protein, partial [Candidatus Hodarchaeales archaeon]